MRLRELEVLEKVAGNSKLNVVLGEKGLAERERSLADKDRQLNELIAQQKSQLLKVAALSMEEARDLLMKRLEKEMEQEMSRWIERRQEEAKERADSQAREIVVTAIQRYAAEHTSEATVSTIFSVSGPIFISLIAQ